MLFTYEYAYKDDYDDDDENKFCRGGSITIEHRQSQIRFEDKYRKMEPLPKNFKKFS